MFSWGNSQYVLNYQGLYFLVGRAGRERGKECHNPGALCHTLLSIHALLIERDFVQYFFVVLCVRKFTLLKKDQYLKVTSCECYR
jgi:hypothetical protein